MLVDKTKKQANTQGNKQLVTNVWNILALQNKREPLVMENLGRPPMVTNTYTGCTLLPIVPKPQ